MTVSGYEPDLRFGQSSHSYYNIWQCFERIFESSAYAEANKARFAEYMVLDAVVGNTDRHHENWGLLLRRVGDRGTGGLAPSFDHASSLGRELLDERRALLLREGRVGRYSEQARGGIHWDPDARYGPSHLELLRRAVGEDRTYFQAVMERVAELSDPIVTELVARVPSGWMSSVARQFAVELIRYNRNEIGELLE